MTDHTPTMARIEDMYAWAYAWRIEDGDEDTDLSHLRESQRAEFQRALAAHNRKIAAEALREAAEHCRTHTVLWSGGRGVIAWLRERADRIEQGGES